MGMVSPTRGAAFLNGSKVHPGRTGLWKDVGYLVEAPYSYPDLSVRENLEITRRLRFLPDAGSVNEIIDRLRLGPYRDRKSRILSSGNAQRLGLAKALLHNPQILILDEPSNGLDPAGIVEIRNLLQNLALNHGKTVFISSHILAELSRFATRIGIIHDGRLIQEVGTDRLGLFLRRRLLIKSIDTEAARSALLKAGHRVSVAEDGTLNVEDEQAIAHPDRISAFLVHAGCPPAMLKVEEEDLESYFLRTIGVNGGAQ